jgi:hypothetical protein
MSFPSGLTSSCIGRCPSVPVWQFSEYHIETYFGLSRAAGRTRRYRTLCTSWCQASSMPKWGGGVSSTRSTLNAVSGTWIVYKCVSEKAVYKYVGLHVVFMRFDVMHRPCECVCLCKPVLYMFIMNHVCLCNRGMSVCIYKCVWVCRFLQG